MGICMHGACSNSLIRIAPSVERLLLELLGAYLMVEVALLLTSH